MPADEGRERAGSNASGEEEVAIAISPMEPKVEAPPERLYRLGQLGGHPGPVRARGIFYLAL